MIFISAMTQFFIEIFGSVFAAWMMAFLIFGMLLSWLIDLIGGVASD